MTTMIDQETPTVAHVFTALDRCDARCTGQAYHRWTKDGLDLFFCNHHNEEYKVRLFTVGFDVESDTAALSELGVKQYIYSEQ